MCRTIVRRTFRSLRSSDTPRGGAYRRRRSEGRSASEASFDRHKGLSPATRVGCTPAWSHLSKAAVGLSDTLIDLAKKVPIDLGQGYFHDKTKGKLIARELVPEANGGATALDVGCRIGVQSRWLEDRGYRVTSIDVEKAYEHAAVVDANDRLPYPDESFDLVWCSEVIEHLRDPAYSADELRRVLKTGGRLVITTPNSYAWFFRLLDLAGLPPARLQDPGHVHFFRLDDVRRLFPEGRIYGYFPYALYKRRIERGLGLLTPTFVVLEIKGQSLRDHG
jgi:SAM-dependent methyltransferase